MKQALWIGLLIISAGGCARTPQGVVNGPRDTNNPKPPVTDDKITNVTDISKCNTNPAEKPSLLKSWSADFTQGSAGRWRNTYIIQADSISMHVRCSAGGKSIVVQTFSKAAITEDKIYVVSNDRVERTYNDGKTKFTCTSELKAGEVYSFEFQGPCLKMQENNSEPIVYIPQTGTLEE